MPKRKSSRFSNRALAFAAKQGFGVGLPARRFKRRQEPVMTRGLKYGNTQAEVKFLQTDITVGTSSITGTVLSLNSLAQGTSNITRVGNKIQIKSVEIKGRFTYSAGLGNPPGIAAISHRWAIVLDKEPEEGAIATPTEIYDQSETFTAGNECNLFRNVERGAERFVILATGVVDQQPASATAGALTAGSGDTNISFEKFVKCNISTRYSSATATQGAMASNQLLFYLISTAADAGAEFFGLSRIRFTDQ